MLQTAVLLLGLLAQDPQKPQDPNRPPDQSRSDLKTNATIDPELRAAVDSLKRSTGFKYRADGTCTCAVRDNLGVARTDASGKPLPAEPTKPEDRVAHAKERAGDVPHDVHIDGTFERGKAIHIVGDDFEAYRLGDKIVYKSKNATEWTLVSRTSGTLGTDSRAGGGTTDAKGDVTGTAVVPAKDDARLIPMLARLPAPSELLDDLDSQIVSCTRVTGDKSSGGATFECVLKPRAGGPLGQVDIQAPPRGAPASATTVNPHECKLRVTVKQGAIDDLALESHGLMGERVAGGAAPPGNPPSEPNPGRPPVPPTQPTPQNTPPARGEVDYDTICDMTCHYRITDLNGATVQVPEPVQRLLER